MTISNPSDAEVSLENILLVGRATIVDPCSEEGDKSLRFGAFVRGWLVDEYILLDARLETDRAGALNRGQQCILRFMADGTAYAFPTRVIDMGTGAYYSFFRVTWPTEIKRVCVRKYERVDVDIPVAVEAEEGTPTRGYLIDLSAGGCRIVLPKSFEKNDKIILSFNLPDGTAIDKISGIVRNVITSKDKYFLGLQFESLTEEQRRDIEFFVTTTFGQKRADLSNERWVLIIDSKTERVADLLRSLEQQGVKAVLEESAVTGIARMSVALPSVTLISYEQNACTGIDVCKVIRSTPRYSSVPIYIYGVGGKKDQELSQQKIEQAGATGLFQSIQVIEPVVKTIKNILSKE
ncbi:MAG TPA: PilZ domain-containing protein [Candidatus Hydrogenedentes bacterium]|nr:PilZ domain-containing protein [Candidatus Hydrogenedentota bacterium]HOL76614.1 PilZ domain-containing protein [Candidatus Hydrogenedentota bacterium]HPO84447.1 PilZ domain-containing protein [Candidatus Hydrogenedentota bacterium]